MLMAGVVILFQTNMHRGGSSQKYSIIFKFTLVSVSFQVLVCHQRYSGKNLFFRPRTLFEYNNYTAVGVYTQYGKQIAGKVEQFYFSNNEGPER